jgi:hypothetical protein
MSGEAMSQGMPLRRRSGSPAKPFENTLDGRRLLLEARRVSLRQTGVDQGRKGIKDDAFDTRARRLGNLIRLSPAGSVCRIGRTR